MAKLQLAQLYFYSVNQNTVQLLSPQSLSKMVAERLLRLEATTAFTAVSGFYPMQVQKFFLSQHLLGRLYLPALHTQYLNYLESFQT